MRHTADLESRGNSSFYRQRELENDARCAYSSMMQLRTDASSILKRDKTKDAFKNVPKLDSTQILPKFLNNAKLNFKLNLLKEIGNTSNFVLTKSVKIEKFMHKTPSNKNVKVYT